MALILHPDLSVEVLDTFDAPGGRPTLEQLQKAVGGYIEIVRCTKLHCYLVVNEEGLLDGLPHNAVASYLVSDLIRGEVRIVGSVVLATHTEIDDPPEGG